VVRFNTYLWGQVEPEIAVVGQAVLDEQGNLVAEAELHWPLRPEALQKLTRYLSEKVKATGSVRLISTFFSEFSTSVCWRRVTEPFPMSPVQANLTPSFVHSMETVCVSACC
jgi:hypothetical protein